MIMESPAKRLRILQSVEVDETNPDYIEAKQKQQQKFKSRLERIFDKYGSMHESMSDEIDFKTGKVVVDRGHIRRVQRQLTRSGPTLVDNFLGSTFEDEDDDAPREEEEQIISEDELAPTQTQTRKRKRDSVDASVETAQNPIQQETTFVATPQDALVALSPNNALHVPNTPNPAAHLLQGLQFPQTPLGQQAQAAFVANLNQTIVQAVQQVVAPLFSMLQNTPNGQTAQAHVSAPPLQTPGVDGVRPAADPKWYFPPISIMKSAPRVETPRSSPPVVREAPLETTDITGTSSPLVVRRRSPKVYIRTRPDAWKHGGSRQGQETSLKRLHSSQPLPALHSGQSACHDPGHLVEITPGCIAKRVKSVRKYHFTEEDDAYIRESKELRNMSFKEIKTSKAKWSNWPISAFNNRWQRCLRDRSARTVRTSKIQSTTHDGSPTPGEHDEHFFSSIETPETSSAEHRLPTPNSLEQGSDSAPRLVIPPSSHFDDEELELLSLAGADASDLVAARLCDDEGDLCPAPDEPLPSIEGAEFRNEDDLQLEMLKTEESPTPEPTHLRTLPSTIPETQESAVVASPPAQQPKVQEKPMPKAMTTHRASSDSSDDLDLIGTNDEPATPYMRIKREPSTPHAARILCSSPALKTPRPAPQSSGLTAKSTGKLNRRAFLNDVKKGWAKGKGKTSSGQKRRSLNMAPKVVRKEQAAPKFGDSEDELAV